MLLFRFLVAMQASADGVKKDVFLGKVADLSSEKHKWIENRLRDISDLMKKASNVSEVSHFSRISWLIIFSMNYKF